MNKTLILTVEDDRPVRNLIVTTLKTHDYKYLTAENGNEAVMEAASHNPDIILLDLGLPDMDGIEVIKRIRTWSNMPIIVISARSEESDKIEALDAGADDYLTKPFSVEELLARLRVTERRLKLMRSGTEAGAPIFINGDLKYNALADNGRYEKIYNYISEDKEPVIDFTPDMLVDEVKKLNKDLGIPSSLSEVGVTEDKIEAMAKDAVAHPNVLANPRQTNLKEMIALYKKAL